MFLVNRKGDVSEMKSDTLFGELIYDDLWLGKTEITMFGKNNKIDLLIYGEDSEPITINQRDAYVRFKENMVDIIKVSEVKIYDYYLRCMDEYQLQKPSISSISELVEHVTPMGLLLDYDYEDGIRRIGIVCNCSWEREHGLGVRIENETVVEIGLQDIVL